MNTVCACACKTNLPSIFTLSHSSLTGTAPVIREKNKQCRNWQWIYYQWKLLGSVWVCKKSIKFARGEKNRKFSNQQLSCRTELVSVTGSERVFWWKITNWVVFLHIDEPVLSHFIIHYVFLSLSPCLALFSAPLVIWEYCAIPYQITYAFCQISK